MKICVVNGSPKGGFSITYQTVLLLEKLYPECVFETILAGSGIKRFEKDFTEAKQKLENADIILFCYPVYTFIVPYQLHRFIELIKENNLSISGKCALQISTSKHFYDVTAHNFIAENCADLNLNYLGGLSLDMEDMLSEKGRKEIADFWDLITFRYEKCLYKPVIAQNGDFNGVYESTNITVEKSPDKKVIIVSARYDGDIELEKMIKDFQNNCTFDSEVIELKDFPFKGGCLGCLNCATTGKCVYTDGFDDFLRNRIQKGNAIVYAFRVKDHSMGALMKLYDDRQFCNGHRTVTMGMPFGYLVLGDLSKEPNLNTIMQARADVGGNFLAGIATDKEGVLNLATTLDYALNNNVNAETTFYGVGGTRIFRDLIWVMRGIMQADHKFFKEHGLYDFPQKKRGTMIKMKFVGKLISNPKIKAKLGNVMNEGMLAPYKKVLEDIDKQNGKKA